MVATGPSAHRHPDVVMISRATKSLLAATAAAAFMAAIPVAHAQENDRRFFSSVAGEWSGPGEIVAGKYAGTKFVCNFTGATPADRVGMSLDGGCRVGLFTQRMSARIERQRQGYRGTFMDGAAGQGLDIVSGAVTGREVVFSLNRNALNGAMQARLPDPNTMHVTISVRVDDTMVPVIGVNLSRVDRPSLGAAQGQ
jgi:hypothetical protein